MWARDHYQFFPMILVGFCWLVWERVGRDTSDFVFTLTPRVVIYVGCSLLLGLVAVRLNSHWFAILSTYLAWWSFVWLIGGPTLADSLRGPFLFLGLLVPLPLNLDLKLIVELQKLATTLASGSLDMVGLRHNVTGVVLRTYDKEYMVEQACSGVHSLFSALSVLVFVGVRLKYSGFRLVLTAIQTLLWVLAANGLRVFLVVYFDRRFGISLDVGWRHEALGFLTFALAMFFAASTDQLIRFFLPLSESAFMEVQREFRRKFVSPFRWISASLLDKSIRARGTTAVAVVVVMAFSFVSVAGFGVYSKWNFENHRERSIAVGHNQDLSMYVEDDLPESIDGWAMTEFRSIRRNPEDPYGLNSVIWGYSRDQVSAGISVDGFYNEWHDLAYCYSGSGWSITDSSNLEGLDAGGEAIPYTRLLIRKPTGETAAVFFSCFDSENAPVAPNPAQGDLLRTLRDRLFSAGFSLAPDVALTPPVYQIQLLVNGNGEFLPQDLKEYGDLFIACRSQLRDTFREGLR